MAARPADGPGRPSDSCEGRGPPRPAASSVGDGGPIWIGCRREVRQRPAPTAVHGDPHSMAGALPTFIIIGAQKCGTTSLHTYLGLHPEIGVSREKELNFFLRPDGERDLDWYRSWFDPSKPVRGEASPGYTNHPLRPGVPERMHAVVPDARLIFVVRDPLKRALSQYRHYCADRREDRSAEEALGEPGSKYVVRSRYAFQLDRYLPIYPMERILVVQQERLLDRRAIPAAGTEGRRG